MEGAELLQLLATQMGKVSCNSKEEWDRDGGCLGEAEVQQGWALQSKARQWGSSQRA